MRVEHWSYIQLSAYLSSQIVGGGCVGDDDGDDDGGDDGGSERTTKNNRPLIREPQSAFKVFSINPH